MVRRHAEHRGVALVWQHCVMSLTCSSILLLPPPSSSASPALSLPPVLFLLPPMLPSLQEVLELAFSVLYESDEYLNFIAPDKHEVRRRCLCAAAQRRCLQNTNTAFMQVSDMFWKWPLRDMKVHFSYYIISLAQIRKKKRKLDETAFNCVKEKYKI